MAETLINLAGKFLENMDSSALLIFVIIQEVPDPVKFFVTRWSQDPWTQMAYSFVKTGGSGEAYDILAEDVQGKIFFAGEVNIFITVTKKCSISFS